MAYLTPETSPRYIRRFGYYLGWLASVILIIVGWAVLLINSVPEYARYALAASIFYYGVFGIWVLCNPEMTAGKGKPALLSLIYIVNVLLAVFFYLIFTSPDVLQKIFNGKTFDRPQIVAITVMVFLFSFILTAPVRFVLGLADEGCCTLLRIFKPWRLAPSDGVESAPTKEAC